MKLFQMPTKKMPYRSIRSLLLSCFVLLSISASAQRKTPLDKIVAKIGDEYILYSDIQNQKLSMLQNGIEVDDGSDCQILEGLLYEKLLTNQARIDSVEVKDEVVNQEMESRLNVIAQQIGSIEKLEEFYGKSVAQIKAEFFETIRKRMQAERMKEQITQGVDVTPKEVKKFFLSLPKDSIPYINSKVTVAQIVMYPQVTEKDKQMAMDKITKARENVINGVNTFKMEAFNTSMDPGSRMQGGDLGWQSRGTMVPEFEAELFKLEKNEISPIFETQFGYHFIQLLDRKGDNYHVRHILVSPQTDRKALFTVKTRMDSVYKALNAGTISFKDAARLFSDDENSKDNGGKIVNPYTGDYKWDISNINEIDPQMSRLVDQLQIGKYSSPGLYDNYTEQKQGVRIVKLLGKTKPHQANLESDYQLIQTAALNAKKQRIIDEWIERKIGGTYIWIEDGYSKCDFKHEWVKVGGS